MFNKINWKKGIKVLITISIVVLLAFMFDQGRLMWGIWGFVGLVLISFAFKLYKSWDNYKEVVNLGANQIDLIVKNSKRDKKK